MKMLITTAAAAALVFGLAGCGGAAGSQGEDNSGVVDTQKSVTLASYLLPDAGKSLSVLERWYSDLDYMGVLAYHLTTPVIDHETLSAAATTVSGGEHKTGSAFSGYDYGSSVGFSDHLRIGLEFALTAGGPDLFVFANSAAPGDVIYEMASEEFGFHTATSCFFAGYSDVADPNDFMTDLYEAGLNIECESRTYTTEAEMNAYSQTPERAIKANYVFVKGYGLVHAQGVLAERVDHFGQKVYAQKMFSYYLY